MNPQISYVIHRKPEATSIHIPYPSVSKDASNFFLPLKGPESVDIDLMYSFGRKSGLPLQPRFRTVRHVQKGGPFASGSVNEILKDVVSKIDEDV